jgi:pimeloyl-ACP methyl ester carboxylesterase
VPPFGVARHDHRSLVADAVAVIHALGGSRCILAPESAGAQTAPAVAARYPDLVSRLIIVDGMVSRSVASDGDAFLAGLRSNYPQTIERFVQLCWLPRCPTPSCRSCRAAVTCRH